MLNKFSTYLPRSVRGTRPRIINQGLHAPLPWNLCPSAPFAIQNGKTTPRSDTTGSRDSCNRVSERRSSCGKRTERSSKHSRSTTNHRRAEPDSCLCSRKDSCSQGKTYTSPDTTTTHCQPYPDNHKDWRLMGNCQQEQSDCVGIRHRLRYCHSSCCTSPDPKHHPKDKHLYDFQSNGQLSPTGPR